MVLETKKVTRNEVARRAGVVPSTVSDVINNGPRPVSDETRAKVLAAIDALEYRPNAVARQLRRQCTTTIGLIVPDTCNTYFAEVAQGIEAVAYPDYAQLVCRRVAAGEGLKSVLVCGTSLGMSIAANKVAGIRAALCHDVYTAHQARAHTDVNVLCMGAWIVSPQRAEGILDGWLSTDFEAGWHQPRLIQLENPALDPGSLDKIRFGVTLSPNTSVFVPLLFAGQLEDGMRQAAENGFRVVELSLRKPDDLSEEKLSSLLDTYGLGLSAIATGQSCLHDGMCLAAADPSAVQGAVTRLKAHIDLAAKFEAAVILGGIRGRFTGSADEMAEQRRRALAAVAECAEHAIDRGVQLLLEPINRYETNFINTAMEGLDFIEDVGYPEIKLLLDTFHMNLEEVDINATLTRYAAKIGYIHFADSNRYAPGLGHLQFHQFMTTLIANQYDGVITAEILPLPDDERAMEQAGAFISSLSSAVDDE
ncbi:MAG: RpiB/LacA/LacB family sugar-phosphate isomerase [Chloroflexota bacterium]|nr:RpiB/LacA/LacB family sugar-phosphate isomerase [Chloroflexota bacterium]